MASRARDVVAKGTLHYEGTGSFKPERQEVEFKTGKRVRTLQSWPARHKTPSPWSYAECVDIEDDLISVDNEEEAEVKKLDWQSKNCERGR